MTEPTASFDLRGRWLHPLPIICMVAILWIVMSALFERPMGRRQMQANLIRGGIALVSLVGLGFTSYRRASITAKSGKLEIRHSGGRALVDLTEIAALQATRKGIEITLRGGAVVYAETGRTRAELAIRHLEATRNPVKS